MTARGWSDRKLKITVFFASLVLYLAVGYWLQVRHGFIIGDALSRVSAAQRCCSAATHISPRSGSSSRP